VTGCFFPASDAAHSRLGSSSRPARPPGPPAPKLLRRELRRIPRGAPPYRELERPPSVPAGKRCPLLARAGARPRWRARGRELPPAPRAAFGLSSPSLFAFPGPRQRGPPRRSSARSPRRPSPTASPRVAAPGFGGGGAGLPLSGYCSGWEPPRGAVCGGAVCAFQFFPSCSWGRERTVKCSHVQDQSPFNSFPVAASIDR